MTASFNQSLEPSVQGVPKLRNLEALQPKTSLHLVSPQGQLHVHTAPFRGSFSLVLSESIRTAGLGGRVLIAQFLKGGVNQGINSAVKLCGKLEWLRPAIPLCINEKNSKEILESDNSTVRNSINSIWELCKERLNENLIDRLVLDEIGLATSLKLIDRHDLIKTLESRPQHTDVILTGTLIPSSIINMADQVTNLRSI